MSLASGPPRVMHVINGLEAGGAEGMLASLLLRARAEGREAEVVSLTAGGVWAERLIEAGVRVHGLGLARGRASVLGLWRLARLIRRRGPDVVQSWMYHADLAATLALLLSGRRRRTRLVWGVRCSDMDLRRYPARLRRVVRLCTRLSRLADAVVANAEAGRQVHIGLGYAPRRFVVIENGIDTERFRPDPRARREVRAELGLAPEAPVVAHIARVDPMKDHETFLAAMTRLPRVTALAAGAGTEALAGPSNVRPLGLRHDVARLLAAADLVVSSSAFGEGFSNAVAEGMACGVPAVATEVGDSRRIIGDTGMIVPPGDVDALAGAIAALVAEPAQARHARGARARQRIVACFSLARAAAAFDALYRELA